MIPDRRLPSTGLAHLAVTSEQYSTLADAYGPLLTAAAVAEADYRTARAKAVLVAKATRERCSVAEAETVADADDHIAGLLMTRLTTRALADSHIEKLRQLRSQIDALRSYTASERAADAFGT